MFLARSVINKGQFLRFSFFDLFFVVFLLALLQYYCVMAFPKGLLRVQLNLNVGLPNIKKSDAVVVLLQLTVSITISYR